MLPSNRAQLCFNLCHVCALSLMFNLVILVTCLTPSTARLPCVSLREVLDLSRTPLPCFLHLPELLGASSPVYHNHNLAATNFSLWRITLSIFFNRLPGFTVSTWKCRVFTVTLFTLVTRIYVQSHSHVLIPERLSWGRNSSFTNSQTKMADRQQYKPTKVIFLKNSQKRNLFVGK